MNDECTGNYGIIVLVLAVYALYVLFRQTFIIAPVNGRKLYSIMNPVLLISLAFLFGGPAAINKFGLY